jgi:hypothetical protein
MFTAYFDASGNARDQSFVVVSGYIANFLQWRLFEGMWTGIHRDYGVELPFHTADFVSAISNQARYATQKNARPDYVALAKDGKKANDFLKNLCITQQTVVNCGISCIVNMHIYNDISSLLDLRKVIPPYALAARSCIARVHEWEEQFSIEEPVECIFEDGDFEQEKLVELIKSEGGPAPIFKKKKYAAGLQAADHYAWEQFHYLKKELRGVHLPARNAFKFLLNAIPKMHLEVTRAGLINLCNAKGITQRELEFNMSPELQR